MFHRTVYIGGSSSLHSVAHMSNQGEVQGLLVKAGRIQELVYDRLQLCLRASS